MAKIMNFQLAVRVPDTATESGVTDALNSALDEPPCDWGYWSVGALVITSVERVADDPNTDAWADTED